MSRIALAVVVPALLLVGLALPGSLATVHGDSPMPASPAHVAANVVGAPAPDAPDPPLPTALGTPCSRCASTPDLTQSAAELGLPGEGGSYCGPVAATNALSWLGTRGFAQLVSPRGLPAMPGHLAWKRYLKTHPRRGTLPFDLVRGLERWVTEAGYEVETLLYAGVRDHPARRSAGVLRPNLAFLADGLERDGVVLLHVGWYEAARPHRYTRLGGHWMTLVGVDATRGVLLVHDPAPYASDGAAERIVVRELTEGHVLRPQGLGRMDARGFVELTDGMRLRSPDERAILDGAVVLRVR